MKERKDRVDDALHATKAAGAEGYVLGGGVALIRAIEAIEKAKAKAKGDEKLGFDAAAACGEAPLQQIVTNAGEDGHVVVEAVKASKGNQGYNAATGEYVDMVKAGIIDPALVPRTACSTQASPG
ncbi:MAG: TCP-1/cpn60 chaperonin family protein [Phycisphaerales bacterium]